MIELSTQISSVTTPKILEQEYYQIATQKGQKSIISHHNGFRSSFNATQKFPTG